MFTAGRKEPSQWPGSMMPLLHSNDQLCLSYNIAHHVFTFLVDGFTQTPQSSWWEPLLFMFVNSSSLCTLCFNSRAITFHWTCNTKRLHLLWILCGTSMTSSRLKLPTALQEVMQWQECREFELLFCRPQAIEILYVKFVRA